MATTVTVSSKGQIVIPKNIRDQLQLRDGIKLRVEIRGSEVVFSRPENWRKIRETFRLEGVSATEALLEERKKDRHLDNHL